MRLDAQRLDAVADAVGQLNKRFDNYVIVRKVDELNARFDNYVTRRQDGDVIPFPGRFRPQPTPPKKRTFTAEQLRLTEENISKAKEALARAPEGIQRRARRKELEGWERHLIKIQETILRDQRGDAGFGTKIKAGLRKAANFAGGKPYRAPPRVPQKPLSRSEFAKASPQGQRSELGRMIKAIPDRQDADKPKQRRANIKTIEKQMHERGDKV